MFAADVRVRELHGRFFVTASCGEHRVTRAVDRLAQVAAATGDLVASLKAAQGPPPKARRAYYYTDAEDACILANWETLTPAEIAAALPRPPDVAARTANSVWHHAVRGLGLPYLGERPNRTRT